MPVKLQGNIPKKYKLTERYDDQASKDLLYAAIKADDGKIYFLQQPLADLYYNFSEPANENIRKQINEAISVANQINNSDDESLISDLNNNQNFKIWNKNFFGGTLIKEKREGVLSGLASGIEKGIDIFRDNTNVYDYNLLIIGDGYTNGIYGQELEKLFKEKKWTTTKIAYGGATAKKYLEGENSFNKALANTGNYSQISKQYDFAIFTIGTNDLIENPSSVVGDIKKLLVTSSGIERKYWVSPPTFNENTSKFVDANKKDKIRNPDLNTSSQNLWNAFQAVKQSIVTIDSRPFTKDNVSEKDIQFNESGSKTWAKLVYEAVINDLNENKLDPSKITDPIEKPDVLKTEEEKKTSVSSAEEAQKQKEIKIINSSKLRLNEQAALMLNSNALANLRVWTPNNQEKRENPRVEEVYKNFCTYRNGTQGSGGHIDLTKNFFKSDDIRYLLKEIPSYVISSLLPSIKLYKVFFPDKEKSGPNAVGHSWRIPFDDVPVKFGEETSEYQEGTIEEILAGTGRMHGVGIKSFRYKYVGTNPAEVNTNIEADLEIYLQDVRDIVKEIPISKNHPNFSPPLGNGDEIPKDLTFSYADLIADVGRTYREMPSARPTYNQHYYRIKAVIGYSEPSSGFLEKLVGDSKKAKSIRDALNRSKVILYLNPHNHDISFEENGSITLKIQYIAAMTSTLASMNAMEIASGVYGKLNELKQKLENTLSEERQKIDRISKNCYNKSQQELESEKNKEREALKKELDEQKDIVERSKNQIYSEIFSRLVGLQDRGRLYQAVFQKEALGVDASGNILQSNQVSFRNEDLALRKKILGYGITNFEAWDQGAFFNKPPQYDQPNVPPADGSIATNMDSDKTAEKWLQTQNDANLRVSLQPLSGVHAGNFAVKFVFLGDVIDIFCDVLKNIKNPTERPRLITTDFILKIPNQYKEDKMDYANVILNVADIPVSLEMLKFFLMERMVKPRREMYPLVSLINNIMSDVVAPAVSPTYFGRKNVFNKSIRLASLAVSIPFSGSKRNYRDQLTGRPIVEDFNGILTSKDFKNKNILESSTVQNLNSDLGNYLILYCSNQLPNIIRENNGDYEKDEKDGIYHFYIGSDKGFLKKINFSRTNTPFYKEAKNVNSQGNKSLGRLQEVYDINANMFGNNIFKPGEFIYIEPMFYTGKTAVDLQNKIGLGGYYQIIDVETKINQNIYDTSLRAVLYGRKQDNNKVVNLEEGDDC